MQSLNSPGIQFLRTLISHSVGETEEVPFTFSDPYPLILQELLDGYRIDRAILKIDTPFNGGATIQFGTPSSPDVIFGTLSNLPAITGQYEDGALITFHSSDILQFNVDPGSSTQGTGLLLYRIRK